MAEMSDLIQVDPHKPEPTFPAYLMPLANRLMPGSLTESDLGWAWTIQKKADLINNLARRVDELFEQMEINLPDELKQERAATEYWKNRSHEIEEFVGLLRDRLERQDNELEKMRREIAMARKHPLIVEKSSQAAHSVPQTTWMDTWRKSRGFGKQAAVIEIIGSSGAGFMSTVRKKIASRFGYKTDSSGNISTAIQSCIERGLIDQEESTGMGRGRPSTKLWLTELGQSAYIMLTDQSPVPSELLAISGHMSDKHLLLNIRAKQCLEKAGYELLADSYRYYLDGVRQAVPDITARKDDRFYYIEVERGVHKSDRPEKWINLNELSSGTLYVVCETSHMLADIAIEVSDAMSVQMTPCTLYLTTLAKMENDLNAGQTDFWRNPWEFYISDLDLEDYRMDENADHPGSDDIYADQEPDEPNSDDIYQDEAADDPV
jgi:hypothetical protein